MFLSIKKKFYNFIKRKERENGFTDSFFIQKWLMDLLKKIVSQFININKKNIFSLKKNK